MSKVQFRKVDEGFDDTAITGNTKAIKEVVDAYYNYYKIFVDSGKPIYYPPENLERHIKSGMKNRRQGNVVDTVLHDIEQDLKKAVAAYKHLKQVSNVFKRKTF